MNSLVGYGSDDELENDQHGRRSSVGTGGKRKEDDTNYDDVNMDLSEESQGAASDPGLPAKEQRGHPSSKENRHGSNDSRDRDREHDRDQTDNRDRRRDRDRHDRERRSPKRDGRHNRDRSDRNRGSHDAPRRGLLGDKPDDRHTDNKMPALMDLKPYGGDPPPGLGRSQDARDAVSPRFTERDRRERDDRRERERDRDRESRHTTRSDERRSGKDKNSERSRSRGAAYPPPYSSSSNERRTSPSSGDYRPSSYKVNKKLEAMEKMGLQIKTPDGSMATARQLRAAASEAPGAPGAPPAYCGAALHSSNVLGQVQKRKLLWANKEKSTVVAEAAKWSGARFAQDNDGRQVSKFMRLMGIKEPEAIKPPEQPDATADPNKKQEELFQAMQQQYEVARATTHTMRGVGLGFQRGNF